MPSQEEFEDKFRKKFEDWEAPAPAWESFQVHIPPTNQKSKPKYRLLLLWWLVGGAMLLGGGSIGTWLMLQRKYSIGFQNKTYPSTAKKQPKPQNKDAKGTNLPTQAGKDSTNALANSPTQAGKDSTNTLANSPTQAGKDSTNALANSPTQADSTQQKRTDRLIFATNSLPILPLKSAFELPTPNYSIDSTLKWEAKKIAVGKWAIAGYVAPVYAYKIVKPNTRDSIFIEHFVANKRMTTQNKGYQIGGRAERRLGNRIGVYGGLQYQYSRLQTDYMYYAIGQSNYRVDSLYQYRVYLTPLNPHSQVQDVLVCQSLLAEVGVHYRVHWRRWETLLGVGVGYQYALNVYFKNGSERYRVPYEAHHFITQASWQIGYALTPQKRVFVEPLVQNNHTRLFKEGAYHLRTYQVGWRVGMKWRL